jgi:hypothetical protein
VLPQTSKSHDYDDKVPKFRKPIPNQSPRLAREKVTAILFEDTLMFEDTELLEHTDDAFEEGHVISDNFSTLSPDLCPMDLQHPNSSLVPYRKTFQESIESRFQNMDFVSQKSGS